jgi:hypothetical protein
MGEVLGLVNKAKKHFRQLTIFRSVVLGHIYVLSSKAVIGDIRTTL